MRAFVFVLSLLLAPALVRAQAPTPLVPTAGVQRLWQKVVACAGPARDTTKTFDQIHFFLRPPVYYQGSLIKAEWVAPDTIYITTGYERTGWVVAHEMLHHALNGPPGFEKHPITPFMFPCALLEFQQHAGGMAGGTALPDQYASPEFAPVLVNSIRFFP